MSEQKTLLNRALPGLLIAGSLGGVAAITVGLLAYLSPVDDGSRPTPLAQPGREGTVEVNNVAGQFELPPTVGPGGAGVPLLPAALSAPPPVAAGPVAAPIAKSAKARPLRIRIPKIKVNAPVGSVTVDIKGKLQAPSLAKPNLTGWYKFSPVPGEIGPSVINGHVSTKKGAAVFKRLKEIAKGDAIYVYRTDGKVTKFVVSGIEQVSKSSFPTSRVYGNVKNAQLRLITCGGVYNAKDHSYTDNIIVYATMSKKKG